jgi:hypothetical protein
VGPLIGAGTVPSAIGSNHNAGQIRKHSFRDQLVAYVGPIGIRCVHELHTQLDGPTQNCIAATMVITPEKGSRWRKRFLAPGRPGHGETD